MDESRKEKVKKIKELLSKLYDTEDKLLARIKENQND